MTHSRRFAAALLIAISVGACSSLDALAPESESFAGGGAAAASVNSTASPLSSNQPDGDLFARLANEIPGFGGLYRNGLCAVAVVLTDMTQSDHAIRVVKAALEPNRGCPNGFRVHPVQGQFTYIELQRYLGASRPLLDIRGVRAVAVDLKQNRLMITIQSRTVAQQVIEALPRVGIPVEAVLFQVS